VKLTNKELKEMIDEVILDEEEKKKRSTINFGNVAEGILAAAMAQRFVEGDQDVAADEVYDTINDLEKRGSKSGNTKRTRYEMEWEIERSPGVIGCPPEPGRAKAVPDVLRLIIGLDQKDLDALFLGAKKKLSDVPSKPGKMSDQAQFDGLVNASVAHSNAEMPSFAKTWECNEVRDEIWVIADGIGDQSGTKTDVVVKYKAEDGDMKFVPDSSFGKISLKAGSAQMGQAGSLFSATGDTDGDGIKELMSRIFSVNLKNPSSVGYDKTYKKFAEAEVMDQAARDQLGKMLEKVYSQAYTQIARIFTDGTPEQDTEWLLNLGRGIQYAAALEEDGVYVVDLDRAKGLFSQINFDDIQEVFKKTGADMQVVYDGYYSSTSGGTTKWPNIQVFYCPPGSECNEKSPGQQIVKTRAKVEDRFNKKKKKLKRLAHFIEMGTGLKSLIKQARKMSETKHLTKDPGSYNMLLEMIENLMSEE
jgi:hypothetical protein